jgi:hypothetical protein
MMFSRMAVPIITAAVPTASPIAPLPRIVAAGASAPRTLMGKARDQM